MRTQFNLYLLFSFLLPQSLAPNANANAFDIPGMEDLFEAAGGWSGNGGGIAKEADNPWFLASGPRTIKYCLLRGPEFSVPEGDLHQMILEAMNSWRAFFERYQLHSQSFAKSQGRQRFSFPDGAHRYFEFSFEQATCLGTDLEQNSHVDLMFLFGVSNPTIDAYRTLNSTSDLGLALRRTFDHSSYWNPGYIWVANFTASRERLLHLLLHETGHVFGMPHDAVAVMQSDIKGPLLNQDLDDAWFGQVENSSWRFRLLAGDEIVFSSSRGRKAHRVCKHEDYRLAGSLPVFVRTGFGLRPNDCVRLAMHVEHVDVAERIYQLRLEFKKARLTGPELLLNIEGMFASQDQPLREQVGPGLYTVWLHDSLATPGIPAKPQWLWLPLLQTRKTLPLQGKWLPKGGGQPLPGLIDDLQPVSMRIYLPRLQRWWVIRDVP